MLVSYFVCSIQCWKAGFSECKLASVLDTQSAVTVYCAMVHGT